jgi:hypothetical protein
LNESDKRELNGVFELRVPTAHHGARGTRHARRHLLEKAPCGARVATASQSSELESGPPRGGVGWKHPLGGRLAWRKLAVGHGPQT